MSKIVFIKEPNIIYDGQFSQIGEHQVRLIFEDAVPSNDILLSCDILIGCNGVNLSCFSSIFTEAVLSSSR